MADELEAGTFNASLMHTTQHCLGRTDVVLALSISRVCRMRGNVTEQHSLAQLSC